MFKPSKQRAESVSVSRPETPSPTQSRTSVQSDHTFRESLISLFTEVIATANRLKTGAGADLPAGSGSVLQILEKEGARTVPQIARNRFTSRQNIQIVVNRLAREGLIHFEENPSHKRSVLITLTPKGAELLTEAGKRRQEFLDSLAAQFSPEELRSGAALLGKIRKALVERPSAPEAPSTEQYSSKNISPRKNSLSQGAANDRIERKKSRADAEAKNLPGENLPDTELPFNLL